MLPSFLVRMARRGGYRKRFADRFGFYPKDVSGRLKQSAGEVVWIHAVSVGEVAVAGRLMKEMRSKEPSLKFVFSTTSSTGWSQALKEVGEQDELVYFPLDFPGAVRRALDAAKPRAVILTESEIWPNFIKEAAKRKIPLFIANARVSDRSAPRYKALRFLFGPVLRKFSAIYAQSDLDRLRLVDAGADNSAITVTGSFKFDSAARNINKENEIASWLGDGGPILLAASTWPGEDVAILKIYKKLLSVHPEWRLVIVPRHFEKADAVEANIREAGFNSVRRSRRNAPGTKTQLVLGFEDDNAESQKASDDELLHKAIAGESRSSVYLADTTGELMGFYGNCDIAFVGKSLKEHGSQNMIEPCLCGAATVVGPYTENFRPVMSDLLDSEAIWQADSESELETMIWKLASDPAERALLGRKGRETVLARRGAVARCAAGILSVIAKTHAVKESASPANAARSRWIKLAAVAAQTVMSAASALLIGVCAHAVIAMAGSVWQVHESVWCIVAAGTFTGMFLARKLGWIARLVGIGLAVSAIVIVYFVFAKEIVHSWIAFQESWAANGYDVFVKLCFATSAVYMAAPSVLFGMVFPRIRALKGFGVRPALAVFVLALAFLAEPFLFGVERAAPGFFMRIVYRDSGLASFGNAVEISRHASHWVLKSIVEDYGTVTILDGRPVDLDSRHYLPKRLAAAIAVAERPDAKNVAVIGCESFVYTPGFKYSGLEVSENPECSVPGRESGGFDIVFVAPAPDWLVDGDRFPASAWNDLLAAAPDALFAYHIDARLMSMSRAKTVFADFGKVFPGFHVWCLGYNDWLLTGCKSPEKSKIDCETLDSLFDGPKAKILFRAGLRSLPEIFASYSGDEKDIMPAFDGFEGSGVVASLRKAAGLTFPATERAADGDPSRTLLRPQSLALLEPQSPEWLVGSNKEIYSVLTNRIVDVRYARLGILEGFKAKESGAPVTNVMSFWEHAIAGNKNDPMLRQIAEDLDLEGRRRLKLVRMGGPDVHGAAQCYYNSLLLNPRNVAALHNFGLCLKNLGRMEDAARIFDKAVFIDPELEILHEQLAETAAAAGELHIAAMQVEILNRLHPDDPYILMRLAKLLAHPKNSKGDIKRAVIYAERAAYSKKHGDKSLAGDLADIYIQAGQVKRGLDLKRRIREGELDR